MYRHNATHITRVHSTHETNHLMTDLSFVWSVSLLLDFQCDFVGSRYAGFFVGLSGGAVRQNPNKFVFSPSWAVSLTAPVSASPVSWKMAPGGFCFLPRSRFGAQLKIPDESCRIQP